MNMHGTLTMWSTPAVLLALVWVPQPAAAGSFPVDTVTDMTPTAPLASPAPASYSSRYLSGFGLGSSFTVLFEDRDDSSTIKLNTTTTGPTGFAAANTTTNIADTHFVIKDWPITIDVTPYAYRAWASVGNDPNHHFYVSNDLTTWTLVDTFTIPNDAGFTGARGQVYYGFHDVILLNGTCYAFGESNQGQTMMVRSSDGDNVWEAFASIGGTQAGDGPLQMPESPTPSGSFFDLGLDRGIGKLHVRGNDSALLLAVNTTAQLSLAPADLEAAFINPANWTWHDDTTGLPTTPILEATAEHDLREAWVVPPVDPDQNEWVIVYTADFGAGDGGKALGYAEMGAVPVELMSFTIE
ncbi:MAG: hypothetical protein GY856_08965 [bacterium]|nr:hypothetical protein [bacterium]